MISKTILLIGVLGLSAVSVDPVQGQTPNAAPGCYKNESHFQLRLTSAPPCDIPPEVIVSRNTVAQARFAWNTFIALNWPAKSPYEPPFDRGVAGDWSTLLEASRPNDGTVPDYISIWDSWREKRDLFRVVGDKASGFRFAEPEPFNNGRPPVKTGPVPQVGACAAQSLPGGHVTPLQTNKVENYLDETDEIGLAVLWEGGLTAASGWPTETNLVRYQVKFNQDHYAYVRDQNYWNPDRLAQAVNTEIDSGNGIGVVLPSGSNATLETGSILTKSAWKKLTDAEIKSAEYYTQTALVYLGQPPANPTTTQLSDVCYLYDVYGLIGLHIIRRTKTLPYLLFSTFQFKRNYPNKFTYANTVGTGGTPVKVSSTLPNGHGIAYKNPADPQPVYDANYTNPVTGTHVTTPVPYAADRLIAPQNAVEAVNREADRLLQGTLLENYELVGYQTVPVSTAGLALPGGFYAQGGPADENRTVNGYYPSYFNFQEYYLANPVIETSQRFQFFEGGFAQSGTPNIKLYGQGPNGTVNMGGCMGCHGNAQTTGMSFTLNNVTNTNGGPYMGTNPGQHPVGTLTDTCGQLGLTYDKARMGCQLR